jgi:hypothetical protein
MMSGRCLLRPRPRKSVNPLRKTLRNRALLCCAIISLALAGRADSKASVFENPNNLDEALSWLPADTETITVANGPFWMSNFQLSEKEEQEQSISSQNLEKAFQSLTLDLFNLKKSDLEKYLDRQKLLLAVEGSRHFRSATALGSFLFEGCEIAVFANDVSDQAASFLKASSNSTLRIDEVDGLKVAVFQDRLEEDIWTTFVAFPRKNIVVVATNEGYLRDVLARIRGTKGTRALPDSLPEWKYVNKKSPFWGLRHFDRTQSREDLTSPFRGARSEGIPDDQAIGITFVTNPAETRSAVINYLSDDKNVLQIVTEHLFPIELMEEGGKGLKARYRAVEPGVVQGSFDLSDTQSVSIFLLVLMAQLGHGINI